jgi:hypothetical protein
VGVNGGYLDWSPPWDVPDNKGLKDMRKGALLTALSESRRFAVTLKDVALDECTVRVIRKVAERKPTAEEENAGAPLELCNTVGLLAKQRTTGERLFIHVRLPQEHDQGMYIREAHSCSTLRGVRWCNRCRVFRDRDVNAAQNILAIYAAGEQRPLYLTRGENVNEGRLEYQTVRPFRQGKRSQAARPV